jgi:hypothetical protein
MLRLVLVVMFSFFFAGCANVGSKERPLTYDEVKERRMVLNGKEIWLTGDLFNYTKGHKLKALMVGGVLITPPRGFEETSEHRELTTNGCDNCASMRVVVTGRFRYCETCMTWQNYLVATEITPLSPVEMN